MHTNRDESAYYLFKNRKTALGKTFGSGDKLCDRMFGVISYKKKYFKFGWQSDLIKPFNLLIDTEIYAIGVDRNFAIIDWNKAQVVLRVDLDFFFYTLKINGSFLYVITELEVIKINKNSFKIIEKYELPDIFSDIKFEQHGIYIYLALEMILLN